MTKYCSPIKTHTSPRPLSGMDDQAIMKATLVLLLATAVSLDSVHRWRHGPECPC